MEGILSEDLRQDADDRRMIEKLLALALIAVTPAVVDFRLQGLDLIRRQDSWQ